MQGCNHKYFSGKHKEIDPGTDYGQMKTKSLILCGPNSNSNTNPNRYLGCGYKGLDFSRNNG
jgi:hypothetical protein